MVRRLVCALILLGLAGCNDALDLISQAPPSTDSLAATAQYPSRVKSVDSPALVAVVEEQEGKIRILNSSDEPIADAQAWINRRYMAHVDRLPAHGMICVRRADLLREDRAIMQPSEPVDRVELLVGATMLRPAGPVIH